MRPEESILVFNDRYTLLLEESTNEISETCSSKIIIVAYTDAIHDEISRKLRSSITKFKNHPSHLKAIRTLCDIMDQAQKLEKEQKFINIQDAVIKNISPDSSPLNSGSESDGVEIDTIYSDRRYKSRNQRN